MMCIALVGLSGCGSQKSEPAGETAKDLPATQPTPASRGEVTLYTSLDEPLVKTIVEEFSKQANIRVTIAVDAGPDRPANLARQVRAQSTQPTADVIWTGEPFEMILLAKDGLLDSYLPATAKDIPIGYRDAKNRWIGFGLRARVLAYNPNKVSADALPKTWKALAETPFAEQVVVADPSTASMRGHIAAMLATWGEPGFVDWVDKLAAGRISDRLTISSTAAAGQVAQGQSPLCAADSSDVGTLQQAGQPIAMTYPDMGDGGTLLVPSAAGLVKNAPHGDLAKELMAFLCNQSVEEMLAKTQPGYIPVRPALRTRLNIPLPPASPADYVKITEAMPRAIEIVQQRWKS